MPFEVATLADLQKVGSGDDGWTRFADYVQVADIDASDTETWNWNESRSVYEGFMPIRPDPGTPFAGFYKGMGYKVTGLHIDRLVQFVGLFGAVSNAVHDLYVENFNISRPDSGSNTAVGGVCGAVFSNGNITRCGASGSVSGTLYTGGVCGMLSGVMERCFSDTVVMSGAFGSAGSLIGRFWGGQVTDCYAKGSVDGAYNNGGLIGISNGSVSNCFSVAQVSTGDQETGGLIALKESDGTVTNSFWDIEASGQSWSDGGTGLTTAQMQDIATFSGAGWDIHEHD